MGQSDDSKAAEATTGNQGVQAVVTWLDNHEAHTVSCLVDGIPVDVIYDDIQRAAQNTQDDRPELSHDKILTNWTVTDNRLDVTFNDEANLRLDDGDDRDRLFSTAYNFHHAALIESSSEHAVTLANDYGLDYVPERVDLALLLDLADDIHYDEIGGWEFYIKDGRGVARYSDCLWEGASGDVSALKGKVYGGDNGNC